MPPMPLCVHFRHELTFSFTHGISTWLTLATPNAPNTPMLQCVHPLDVNLSAQCSFTEFMHFPLSSTLHQMPTENKRHQ